GQLGLRTVFAESITNDNEDFSLSPATQQLACAAIARGNQIPLVLENLYLWGGARVAGACYGAKVLATESHATARRLQRDVAKREKFRTLEEKDRFEIEEREIEALGHV